MRSGGRTSLRSTGRAGLPYHHAQVAVTPAGPEAPVPAVIGVDDFALRRRHHYATIITDAVTGRRVEVLPGRDAGPLEAWLRGHPGITTVCRDGSATYAEAIHRTLPDAGQVSDRRHVWRNLCDKVRLEIRAHADCWARSSTRRCPAE